MTINEAIKDIKDNIKPVVGGKSLEMAIDALEQAKTNCSEIPNNSDTISRQQAIDALDCINGAEEVLRALPSAQPEQQWIPCSERLPENGRQVLVYARSVHFALAKYDEMREADGTYKKQWVTFDSWKPFYTIKNVIAWMELPEPYQEGGE